MQTIETRIDAVCEALLRGTGRLRLKCPNDRDAIDVCYRAPTVHPVYLPQGGALTGEQYHSAPSITVMPGTISEKDGHGSFQMTLALVTWDPGTRKDGALVDLNNDGWRSLSGLIDNARRALANAGTVGGMRLQDDVRAGLYDSRNTDLRPYYVGWLEVRFAYHYESLPSDVLNLLN